jgi:hypothetical protein
MSTEIPAPDFIEPGAEPPTPPFGAEFPKLIGLREIAAMLEVEPRTPTVWRDRSRKGHMNPPLPEPELYVSGDRPVWSKRAIIRWASKTGRLPEQRRARDEAVAAAS